jgi:hypothetical protein
MTSSTSASRANVCTDHTEYICCVHLILNKCQGKVTETRASRVQSIYIHVCVETIYLIAGSVYLLEFFSSCFLLVYGSLVRFVLFLEGAVVCEHRT